MDPPHQGNNLTQNYICLSESATQVGKSKLLKGKTSDTHCLLFQTTKSQTPTLCAQLVMRAASPSHLLQEVCKTSLKQIGGEGVRVERNSITFDKVEKNCIQQKLKVSNEKL